jgi:hypothetical protein
MVQVGDDDHDSISSSSSSSSAKSSNGSSNSETSSIDTDLKDYKGFRMVTFRKDVVTQVHIVPRLEADELDTLFYSKRDFARFQASEQKRHDKKMMKQIQEMVHEAMKDQLDAAQAKGATQDEIDAMMPQTPEEIFAILGGMPTPPGLVPITMMKPPPPVNEEHMDHHPEPAGSGALSFGKDDENLERDSGRTDGGDNERNCDDNLVYHQRTEQDPPISSDEEQRHQGREEISRVNKNDIAEETRNIYEVSTSRSKKCEGKKSGNLRDRPEHFEDFSDSELYFMLGVSTEDSNNTTIKQVPNSTRQDDPKATFAVGPGGKKKNQHLHRPEQLLDFSDSDLYAIIGVIEGSEDSEGKLESYTREESP